MNQSDYLEFAQYLTGAAEALDAQLSEVRLRTYFQALIDLSIGDVKSGITYLVRYSRFFPKPVEIREAVFGKAEDRAIVAIDKILYAMRFVGAYVTVCFDDPLIHLIIENHRGWVELCGSEQEWRWLKKELLMEYQAYANRSVPLTAILPALPGIHEIANAGKGAAWPGDKTVFIGDEKKILAWREDRKALLAAHPTKVENLSSRVMNAYDPERPKS
jgi:hypothetical protein